MLARSRLQTQLVDNIWFSFSLRVTLKKCTDADDPSSLHYYLKNHPFSFHREWPQVFGIAATIMYKMSIFNLIEHAWRLLNSFLYIWWLQILLRFLVQRSFLLCLRTVSSKCKASFFLFLQCLADGIQQSLYVLLAFLSSKDCLLTRWRSSWISGVFNSAAAIHWALEIVTFYLESIPIAEKASSVLRVGSRKSSFKNVFKWEELVVCLEWNL